MVDFFFAGSASASVGDPIDIRLAAPPEVLRGGEQIGTLSGRGAALARGCLTTGYALSGVIREVDSRGKSGVAEISGTPVPA
jgi:hypothetical protein